MSGSLAGYDAWLTSPPEYKAPPSGDATVYVERPVPLVGVDPDAGWVELEVAVAFDEGSVFTATLEGGAEIALTKAETERAEVDWAERCAEEPDEPEWDADR